jgi:beta-N-acetylhexosaminidase
MPKKKLFCALALISLRDALPVKNFQEKACAEKLLQKLTTKEKIGQLFIIAATAGTLSSEKNQELLAAAAHTCPYNLAKPFTLSLIQKYHVGGIIFLYTSTTEELVTAIKNYQAISKTPLLIGQDAEWGLSMRLTDALTLPKALTLGALTNNQLLYNLGKLIGKQAKQLGIHLTFSPVADVNTNSSNPVIGERSFGENPFTVAQKAVSMMRGLRSQGILTCAKHFPGHGNTTVDSHADLPIIDATKKELDSCELVPFKALIKAGVDLVMMGHLSVKAYEEEPLLPAPFSYNCTTKLLQKQLGFSGLVITDGLGMQAVTKQFREPGEIELQAVLAGNHLLLCPLDVPAAVKKIEAALADGRLSEKELNRRVLQILEAKIGAGCFSAQKKESSNQEKKNLSSAAEIVKKKCYQEALTWVRKPQITSLCSKESCALLEYKKDASLGSPSLFGQELLLQHKATYIPFSPEITCATLAPYQTIIAPFFDMNNYAARQFGITTEAINFLSQLPAAGKKIIIVLFGSPYSAGLWKEAACLIAYEADPAAQYAAAQVLLGRKKATGKLPITLKKY